MTEKALVMPQEIIENKIFLVRGKKVMFDRDLAVLYGVTTGNLNKAVNRNRERFPDDFMFQLTKEEADSLRFQIGISKTAGRGGRRFLPYAFTENGVAMLSTVLNSERAIHVNIQIMRTFTKLREVLATHKELANKLKELEGKIERHDDEIKAVFDAIRGLMMQPEPKKKKIGF